MPPAVGFPQKKVFERELGFASRKRASARWARYLKTTRPRKQAGP